MTRKEWIEKNLPAYINDRADGGVIGCPRTYRELVRIDPSVLTNKPCKGCIEETARYNIPELGIQMRPLHCKRYEPSPTIEELNTAVFHLQAQHLTDELVRKIFDEENKQWTL